MADNSEQINTGTLNDRPNRKRTFTKYQENKIGKFALEIDCFFCLEVAKVSLSQFWQSKYDLHVYKEQF